MPVSPTVQHFTVLNTVLEMHTRGLNTSVLKLDLPSSPTLLSRGTRVQWLQFLAKLYWLPSLKEHWLSIRKPFRPSVFCPVPQVQTKFYCLLFPCFPQVFAEHERKAIVSSLASLGFSAIVCSFLGEFCLVPLCLLRGIQTQMLAGLGGNIKIMRSRQGNSTLHVQLALPPQHDPSWRWKFLKTTRHRYEDLITKNVSIGSMTTSDLRAGGLQGEGEVKPGDTNHSLIAFGGQTRNLDSMLWDQRAVRENKDLYFNGKISKFFWNFLIFVWNLLFPNMFTSA